MLRRTSAEILSCNYSFLTLSLALVTGTFSIAHLTHKRFFSPKKAFNDADYTYILMILVGLVGALLNIFGLAAYGLGKDIKTLKHSEVEECLKYFYIQTIVYLTEIMLMKVSLLLFYLHVFPSRHLRRLLHSTLAVITASSIAFILVAVLQCWPISSYWQQPANKLNVGKCIDLEAFALSNSALNVATDIWILAIPLSQISKLQMHLRKKIMLGLMFILGTLVTLISILRLRSIIFMNTSNPTRDLFPVALWSTVEINVGMICICIPGAKLFTKHIFRVIHTTEQSQTGYRAIALATIGRRVDDDGFDNTNERYASLAALDTATTIQKMHRVEGIQALASEQIDPYIAIPKAAVLPSRIV